MIFADKLAFDNPRKTQDGYMVVRARAARAGVYEYAGSEIDPKGERYDADATVRVYRPEEEVFAADSVASFLMKPVTNDHPSKPVTADNWREYAKGVVGKALRDGDFLAFDIVLMDKAIIDQVESGKRELSNGYASEIDFTPGQTPKGDHYDAVQKMIRGNHVAVVDKGRAGPMCRIGDAVNCERLPGADLIALLTDERTYNPDANDNKTAPTGRETASDGDIKMPHTLMVDGLQVPNVSDEAKVAIEKLQGQVRDANEAKGKTESDLADANTKLAAKDAEIVTLKQQVEDSKVTPAQLRDQAKAYAAICDKAKALSVEFAEDADAETIMKAVVDAKMGDVAKDYDANQVATAFTVLTKDAKIEPNDKVRDALRTGVRTNDSQSAIDAARRARLTDKQNAYRGTAQGVN